MVQDITAFRKISFQTVDVEVALAEIEYQYLRFVCEATLRNSDEVLREQIRHLEIAGLPSFDEWRKQDPVAVRGVLSPAIEAKTIPTTAIESHDSAVETLVEPPSEQTSDRPASEVPTHKVTQTNAKAAEKPSDTTPSKAVKTLVQSLAAPAMAKLTSREVIEHEHEQLTVLLKEGKTMDDLAALLTSNGAKISASTLRNYLSAARRKAKTGNATATAKKKASVEASTLPVAERSTAPTAAVEPAAPTVAEPPIANATPAATPELSIAPPKPASDRPPAAAKTKQRETSTKAPHARKQPSPLDVSPVPRRRKARI